MSSSDRYGEGRETQRPSLKVATPRSVPPVLGQSSGIDSATDTPIVSNTEVSSPYGEDNYRSPQLRIDTAREVNNESTDFNPPTAGLDTGGLGQKYFDEETYASFGYFDPLAPSPDDGNALEHRFNETEEISSGAPGTEDILGPIEEEGPVVNYGGFFEEEPNLAPILDPTLPPSYGNPPQMSNDALSSTYAHSNAELSASNPALLGQHSVDTHVPESNRRYSQSSLRSYPTRAPETIQGTGLTQHQASYYNAQPSHDTRSRDVRDRPLAGSNLNMGGFSHAHLHALPSNQQLGIQKRRSVSDASVFLQHEHQNRIRMPRTITNTPAARNQRPSGFRTGSLAETMNPGFKEFPHAYAYDFPDYNANDRTPALNTHYLQTHLTEHEGYPHRDWQDEEQDHRDNAYAQQTSNDDVEQGDIYGGPTEILHPQFRGADVAQTRDARGLPQQHISEDNTLFGTIDEAKRWRQRHLVRSNKNDPTIPRTTAEQKHVVRRMVAAINDTDEAMASTYVKYFTDQKYSAEHIESTCWMALDACITRHIYGPLQTEDERAPFKAKVADYNTCAERIEVVIRAFRTQKSICKQLMEPYHLYQFVDDPLAKIKRTENNKALNDRKAEQIAAGRALRGDGGAARARGGKQKVLEEEEFDNGVGDALAGLNSASPEHHTASATVASARSTPAASVATTSRKRTLMPDPSAVDAALQGEYSGPPSKRARTGPTPFTKTLKPGHGQPQPSYQPHSSNNIAEQSYTAEFGDYQHLGQPDASAYGNPSTGGIQGTPYFTQRSNVQRRPGHAYPEIEGYHTPSVGFGLPSPYHESSTDGHLTVQDQQPTRISRHNRVTNRPATSSNLRHPQPYASGSSNTLSHDPTRGQRKRQAESENEGSDFESSQSKRKRRRNA